MLDSVNAQTNSFLVLNVITKTTHSEGLAGYVVRNRILRWRMFAVLLRLITKI